MSRPCALSTRSARVLRFGALPAAALLASACATVHQDQVGVRRTLGKIKDQTVQPGAQFIVPGVQSVLRVPTRTVNREVRLELPSKEGLNVAAEVSILYRLKAEMAPAVLRTSGVAYEDVVVLPVFRSAAADVTARFFAKDMYSGERGAIEKAIQQQMAGLLDSRGFVVEQVLLKSIALPPGLAQAVEEKLAAEQRAEQMRFVLDRERQEADRKRVEAEGVRAAQAIIGSGLTPMLINFESIRAFRELAASPNAKVIVTSGNAPFFVTDEGGLAGNLSGARTGALAPSQAPAVRPVAAAEAPRAAPPAPRPAARPAPRRVSGIANGRAPAVYRLPPVTVVGSP